ncbi:thioredoxin-like protein [Flagelloscypha sp. PMI_526]|nr:thioredoxin-like protein [Flagelloscypha sp. PMI_526]
MSDAASPAITLHYLENSRAQRILFLLEELGVSYQIKSYKRTDAGLAPPELLKVHPLGKSPVIVDEATGKGVAESGAIVEYLIAKFGEGKTAPIKPTDDAWVDDRYFTHFGEATLQTRLLLRLIFSRTPEKVPFVVRPIVRAVMGKLDAMLAEPEIKRCADLIESHLEKQPKSEDGSRWFAGGQLPTGADFMMSFTLETLTTRSNSAGPVTKEYVKQIQSRASYKRGLQKGGAYDYLLK